VQQLIQVPPAYLANCPVNLGLNWNTQEKKTWTNAFLAPLSLTHQGLERKKQDRYNDDPNAYDLAILSIDKFCLSYPKLGPADGAAAYLNALIEN